jgi:Fe-S cluster assembly iron-binding protein IscA
MKTLTGFLIILAGFCLLTACSESDSEDLIFMNSMESSEQNLEWSGTTTGSPAKFAVVITIKLYESAIITHIPVWITVETENALPVFEGDIITNGQRLWVYPNEINKGEQRSDAITIEDAAKLIMRICVGQGGCEQMQTYLPVVSVNASTEGHKYLMSIENASGVVTNDDGTALISVRFTPVNPNHSYKDVFKADYYVYKNELLTDSGEFTLINMVENTKVIKMSENASSGDVINVVIGENYQ